MGRKGAMNDLEKDIIEEVKKSILKKLGFFFRRYGFNLDKILTPFKWKPIILLVGNYSSGKSTFINELIGAPIQRTGQAPTDDSFTIITYDDSGDTDDKNEIIVPGNSIISDPNMPFEHLRAFGENFIAHFRLKKVKSEILKDFAIIDTPGMLDSVTEKDRGYDYLGVIGELARLSDCIVLMFDPHKAGTIKETYKAIRGTLPAMSGEDRIIYCLNRIDECDSIQDLVRSYGTLCWNLSQMTGRKDMPRIFLTYSSQIIPTGQQFNIRDVKESLQTLEGNSNNGMTSYEDKKGAELKNRAILWENERQELIDTIKSAPKMRISHILQEADRTVRELSMLAEAMKGFKGLFWEKAIPTLKIGGVSSMLAFFTGDIIMKLLTGFPRVPFVSVMLSGNIDPVDFILPTVNAILTISIFVLYIQRILFPRLLKQCLLEPEILVRFDSAFSKDIWNKTRDRVINMLKSHAAGQVWTRHEKAIKRAEDFIEKRLKEMFKRYGAALR